MTLTANVGDYLRATRKDTFVVLVIEVTHQVEDYYRCVVTDRKSGTCAPDVGYVGTWGGDLSVTFCRNDGPLLPVEPEIEALKPGMYLAAWGDAVYALMDPQVDGTYYVRARPYRLVKSGDRWVKEAPWLYLTGSFPTSTLVPLEVPS